MELAQDYAAVIFIKNNKEEKTIPLREGTYTIGRGISADICVNDSITSREQCKLVVSDDSITLEDPGSTNGTFINKQKRSEARVRWGDVIEFGNTQMYVFKYKFTPVNARQDDNDGPTFIYKGTGLNLGSLINSQFTVEYLKILNYLFLMTAKKSSMDTLFDFFDVFSKTFPQLRSKLIDRSTKTMAASPKKFTHKETVLNKLSANKPHVLDRVAQSPEQGTGSDNYSVFCGTIASGGTTLCYLYADTKDSNLKMSDTDLNILSLICNYLSNIIDLSNEQQNLIKTIHNEYRIIGSSNHVRNIRKTIEKIKDIDSSVLIYGETGTGKELVARNIHYTGTRANRPFVAVNCATIPGTLFESEFFGHIRGAFTGANDDKEGVLEFARDGTLFLDEIAEMPVELQSKLLRAIETRQFTRIGDTEQKTFNARLICATNKDLKEHIKQQKFREDLYYRIKIVEINLLPLRHRIDDLKELANYYLEQFSKKIGKHALKMSDGLLNKLMNYSWPGNIRELKNCIEAAVIRSSGDEISLFDLNINKEEGDKTDDLTLNSAIKNQIIRVLKTSGGNKKEAAKILGISRSTLYSYMHALGI